MQISNIFNPKLFSLFKQGVNRDQLGKDAMAGVVVGVVALPLSIAFAVACGVSPEKGLITAIIAGFTISALGGSRVQIGGPTGAFIVVIAGIIQMYGINGLIISSIMAGFILIAFGLMRLGNLLKFFSQSLIVGFTSGIALVIFSTQIRDAFGLDIASTPAGFVDKWKVYFASMNTINYYALGITIATILIDFLAKKFIRRIPGSIISIVLFTTLVAVCDIHVTTIESFFGDIPNKMHLQAPQIEWNQLKNYISPAITIALLGGIESLLSAVVSDGMFGGHHRSNTELIAQGVANVITPFFGGIPATGAIARTATNVKNGGRTPVAGMVHAVVLLLIMLFLGKWAKLIPMSCLAGILIVVAYNMSEWRSFVAILKGSYFDVIILLSTFFLTVFVDLTLAIEVGVLLSAVLFMKRMSDISDKTLENNVDSDVIDDYNSLPKDISVYEISGPLFFASAKRYAELITSVGLKHRIIIIRMRHVSFVDMTGIKNLRDAVLALQSKGVKVVISGMNKKVKEDIVKSKMLDSMDDSMFFDYFDEALSAAKGGMS